MAASIYPASEYRRPWKLTTLLIGIGLLIAGSHYLPFIDWDIPISFIMAGFTYLTAPWSMWVLLERRWSFFPLMILATWFSVDGCYAIYWYLRNPAILDLMREVNFPASLSLYGICGIIWLYRGSLYEFYAEVVALFHRKGEL